MTAPDPLACYLPAETTLRSTQRKRFPAYGKQLMNLRAAGKRPRQCVVVALHDWKLGQAFPRIVVTHDHHIDQLDFRMLAGLDVVIVHHNGDADVLRALIPEILAVNPRLLQTSNVDTLTGCYIKLSTGDVLI